MNKSIIFKLDSSDWHGNATETLWVRKGEDGFFIDNIPFYVFGISYDDLVDGEKKEDGFFYLKKIKDGGHSTYRIFRLEDPIDKFDFYLEMLNDLGCTYEKATDKLTAIDVPPDVDIFKAYKILELGLEKGIWDFEEGHCGHPQVLKESSI